MRSASPRSAGRPAWTWRVQRGFLHAQDRFFQMDLARRRAAGELAALVGAPGTAFDREIRIHRFRAEARRAVSLLGARDRAILDAYTAGVNAGLQALDTPPFEYLLLRQTPAPWAPEDSLLVVLSMFVTLQDPDGEYEATLATMHDVLPQAMFDFLTPRGSEWDAPLVGDAFVVPSIPGPDVYNLRAARGRRRRPPAPGPSASNLEPPPLGIELPASDAVPWAAGLDKSKRDAAAIGSNGFAVAGHLAADGGALVANDMHLGIRVPNTWYRASLEWPDPSSPDGWSQISGVTLPGVPAIVVGSNTHVAWGFTNTYADWSDIVLLDVDPDRPSLYLTPQGWRAFERHDEVIEIAGQLPEQQEVLSTIWGPVLEPDYRGRLRAYRWVAHSAEQLAASLTPLESARTIGEAFDEANGLGTPGQNLIVADRSGAVGWSVYGSMPRRRGLDGRIPGSWSDGSWGWDGWLTDAEYPRIVDPPDGRVWTANARVVDGEMLAKLGDGSYEIGSRARIIRDRLAASDSFTPRDLLDIQLDTSAEFLSRWRGLILETLTDEAIDGDDDRALFRDIVAGEWSGQAAPDSAAYRLTREFRRVISERVIAFVLSECYEADRAFDYTTVRLRDAPIWMLVTEQPQHLLDPQYATWTEMLRDSVDATIRTGHAGWQWQSPTRRSPRPGLVRVQRDRVPASAVGRRALHRPLARHAGGGATGRCVYAARAFGYPRRVAAHGRVPGTRGRRHHAHADRSERPSAVAVLCQLSPSVGGGRADAVPARTRGAYADADSVRTGLGLWALERGVTHSGRSRRLPS